MDLRMDRCEAVYVGITNLERPPKSLVSPELRRRSVRLGSHGAQSVMHRQGNHRGNTALGIVSLSASPGPVSRLHADLGSAGTHPDREVLQAWTYSRITLAMTVP